jgi:cell division protein ZapE
MSGETGVGVLAAVRLAARVDGFVLDDAQARAAVRLDELSNNLRSDRGVYLWGPAGRGKTWLLDNFFVALPTPRKKRFHFQAFFADYHRVVHRHGSGRHATDAGIDELLGDVDVVCFDEFHAHDPGDATLLTRLLRALLVERRATIVITSNYEPDRLLPNPRWHHTFEPGIGLIKSALDVVSIDASVDYRTLSSAGTAGFAAGTYRVVDGRREAGVRIQVAVGARALQAMAVEGEAIEFEFDDLCNRPVSAVDVLALCATYRTWTIHNVPELRRTPPEAAQRFVNFIDVLHDQNATVHITSSAARDALFYGDPLPVDALRARSRLSLLTAIDE